MIRRMKVLGLCLVAVFAFSAVAASAASALNFQAGSYTAAITGTQEGANTLSNGVREITCATASLTGTLTASSTTVTINPAYSNCTGNANTTATVGANFCNYTLHATEGNETSGKGTVTIDCPEGSTGMVIDIWATGKRHDEKEKLCRLKVPAQGPITGVSYEKVTIAGKKALKLSNALTTLTVNRVEGTALNCGAAKTEKATYNGVINGSAKKEGAAVDLFIA